MERNKRKEFKEKPLYRKVNTTCHGGKMYHGNHEEYERGTKQTKKQKSKMKGGQQHHGLDYSPLFGFLRKNVGKKWSELHPKIITRLPSEMRYNPLKFSVLSYKEYLNMYELDEVKEVFGFGESTTHSLMYVDENDLLQFVNPNLTVENMTISCRCCTHTFNGKVIPLHKRPEY